MDGGVVTGHRDASRLVHVVSVARLKPHAVHRNVIADPNLVLRCIYELVTLAEVIALRRLIKHV